MRFRIFVLTLLLVSATNANAYIDPGTGSLIIQGAIAALAAIVTTASLYYHRLKAFFTGKSVREVDITDENKGRDESASNKTDND